MIKNMKILDTENEDTLFEYEQKKNDKEREILMSGYSVDDFVLIRTTNFLEQDHVLKPLCKIPFVTNINSVAHNAMYQILQEKTNVDIYDEEAYDKFTELVNNNSPLSSQYRSTIHFTLNGLVSSHSKGTFDNQNFIIIDRLRNHLGTDNIRSIRMEDTFVSDGFPISGDAVIMIDVEKYQDLITKYPWLDSYNIQLFKGDEKLAVEMTLLDMGIMPEKIETHSAKYSERTPLYEEYFASVKQEYGIEEIKHFYSKEYAEDDQKNLALWQIYDRHFYNELFEYYNMNKEEKNNVTEFLISYNNVRAKQEEMFKNIILKIGIDNYCNFVQQYNKKIMTAIENGTFPSNDKILSDGIININSRENKVL